MSKARLALVAAVVLVVGFLLVFVVPGRRDTGDGPLVDLIALFPEAEKRTTMGSLTEAFAVIDVTLHGERRRAIFAHPTSRITWDVDVPADAVLRTEAGMRLESWTAPGDGATFRIGIGDGPTYREVYERLLDPYNRPEDRGWAAIEIDLAPYAGRRVRIVFNTTPGPWDNAVRDAAVWGAPRIERRQPPTGTP